MRNKKMKILFLCLTCMVMGFSINVSATNQMTVTTTQAQAAYDYALQYVNHEVAYMYGGRLTVADYLDALADKQVAGTQIGVDASALVVNSYQAVVPNLGFSFNATQSRVITDATSSILANYNSQSLELEELVAGDLIFFKNSAGNINGVAIFSEVKGDVIFFITASANAGKVVLTNARLNGDYWQGSCAGYARLEYMLLP